MDERHAERVVTDSEVECHFGGVSHRFSLHDLSTEGCMLEDSNHLLPQGRVVLLSRFGSNALAARVVWQRGGFAGLRFATPLPIDMVQRYEFKIREQAAERFSPLDRFGRALANLPTYQDVLAFFEQCPPSEEIVARGNGSRGVRS